MSSVTLLSEIHPKCSHIYNPLAQAYEWYQLITREEFLANYSFIDAIQLIDERCQQINTHLVIRDWAHIDFIGAPFNPDPLYKSILDERLSVRYEVRKIYLVRNPTDTWLSINRLPGMQSLSLEVFMRGYRKYSEQCVAGEFIKYEDFTLSPSQSLSGICDSMNLPYDEEFINNWAGYSHITGAVHGKSRGSKLDTIKHMPPYEIPDKLQKQLSNNSDYQIALDMLGY